MFPEVGLYRQEEELNEYGSDEAMLRRLSAFTGGRLPGAAATSSMQAAGRFPPRCGYGLHWLCWRWR